MVMNVIAGKSPAPSSIASIIYGISSLVLETCSFEVSNTRRNGNQLHLLAKHAQYVEHYINWIELFLRTCCLKLCNVFSF